MMPHLGAHKLTYGQLSICSSSSFWKRTIQSTDPRIDNGLFRVGGAGSRFSRLYLAPLFMVCVLGRDRFHGIE